MKKLTVQASLNELQIIQNALSGMVEEHDGDMRSGFQLELALEEMFVNIVNYAYGETNEGCTVDVEMDYDAAEDMLCVTLIDEGQPFNPLEKADVDVEELSESGQVGGLGIHLLKETMNRVTYSRQGDKNVLTFWKKLK